MMQMHRIIWRNSEMFVCGVVHSMTPGKFRLMISNVDQSQLEQSEFANPAAAFDYAEEFLTAAPIGKRPRFMEPNDIPIVTQNPRTLLWEIHLLRHGRAIATPYASPNEAEMLTLCRDWRE